MLRRKYSCFLFIFFIMLIFTQKAHAHAYIISSTPSENEVLATAPKDIKIEFNEAIQEGFLSVEVKDSTNKRVDKGNAHIDLDNQNIVLVSMKEDIPEGLYSVQWRVVSADGHQISGEIPFSLGDSNGTKPTQENTTSEAFPAVDIVLGRGMLYTGFSLYAGFLLFSLALYKENQLSENLLKRSKHMLWLSIVLIGVSLLYSLPMQTKENASGSWADAFQLSLLKETLQSTIGGRIWIVQITLFILLFFFSYKYVKTNRLLSFRTWWIPTFLFLSLLGTKAWLGHAYSSEYRLLTIPMDFLHLVTASIWIGGIISITYLWRKDVAKDREEYWKLVQRFSPWAMSAVAVLLFSGFISAILYLPDIHMLFRTTYGRVLLLKIILVMTIMIFGWIHHQKSRLSKGDELRKSIKIQVMLGVCILMVASFLANTPTPQISNEQANPYSETVSIETDYKISLSITPNQPGKNVFRVMIKDSNGNMVKDIQQVTITLYDLSNEGEQKGTTFRVLETKPGVFEGENLYLNKIGSWHIQIHCLTKDLENIDAEFHVQ